MSAVYQIGTEATRKFPHWETSDGRVLLVCADCLDVLPTLEVGSVDAVVTDPPYGIGEARGKNKSRACLAVSRDYGVAHWDDGINQPAVDLARLISNEQVIFGGNYYQLPPSSCWLVWDKLNGNTDFADCELAWTNLRRAVRRLQFRWHGMIKDGNDPRGLHPTQKPERVMEWAVSFTSGETILDPFMGSGTTGIAAVRLGRRFLGCETDPKHYATAKRRIIAELERMPLFEDKPKYKQKSIIE